MVSGRSTVDLWVQPGRAARILELGCGDGSNIVRWVKDAGTRSVVGVDLLGNITATAKTIGEELTVDEASRINLFESFIEDLPNSNWVMGPFTDVVLSDVPKPHSAALQVLWAAWSFVGKDGALWITTFHHRAATLAAMLQDVGVDVAQIKWVDEVPDATTQLTRAYVVRDDHEWVEDR